MAVELKLNGSIQAGGYAGGPVSGTTGTFSGAVSGASIASNAAVTGTYFAASKIKTTPEGGLAVKLTNESGAESIKGQIVTIKSTVDNAFDLTAVDAVRCHGVVYESGVANAAECWVVVKGIAEVLFKNATTRGHMARIPLTADTGEAAGYAMDAAQETTTPSIYKIGDVLESGNADTLVQVLLD